MKLKNSTPCGFAIDITLTILIFASTGMAQERSKEAKFGGTYWSAQRPKYPPLPANPFPDLPVEEIAPGIYVYDDRDMDYVQLEAEARATAKAGEAEPSSLQSAESAGGGMPMMMQGGGLCLLTPQFAGGNVVLNIAGAEAGARYDVFVCTNLSPPVQWSFVTRGAEGQTNLPFAAPEGSVALFQLGTLQDTDGDTLTDAYEALVSHTDPNVADTVETAAGNPQLLAALTPEEPLLYLHTYGETYRSELIGNPNPCTFGPPLFEQNLSISWTNFVGGKYDESWKIHGCFTETQTERTTNDVVEGKWRDDDTGCTRRSYNDGLWSDWICGPGSEVRASPRSEGFVTLNRARPIELGGVLYQENETRVTKVRLRTGGPPFSLKKRLWGLRVFATDYGDGWSQGTIVAPEAISVMGKHPNSNGWAYFLLQDRTTNDLELALPPEFRNYEFTSVSTAVADLKLLIDGEDGTDRRVQRQAGASIAVFCKLDPEIVVITNYLWTIPNEPISNWVATATLGEVIPLPLWIYTNAAFNYYWWKRATEVRVLCSVIVEGVMMDVKTTCEVKKPAATITTSTPGVVSVDYVWAEAVGVPALHFGNSVNGPPGIRFERTHDPIARWDWLQIINNSVRRQHDSVTNQWRRSAGQGLDNQFPYPRTQGEFIAFDSPGFQLAAGVDEATASDSFTMYLMYKPSGANCIYVPVASVDWSWSGRAAIINNEWSLLNDPAFPTTPNVGPSVEAVGYPTWQDNFSRWRFVWDLE